MEAGQIRFLRYKGNVNSAFHPAKAGKIALLGDMPTEPKVESFSFFYHSLIIVH